MKVEVGEKNIIKMRFNFNYAILAGLMVNTSAFFTTGQGDIVAGILKK